VTISRAAGRVFAVQGARPDHTAALQSDDNCIHCALSETRWKNLLLARVFKLDGQQEGRIRPYHFI